MAHVETVSGAPRGELVRQIIRGLTTKDPSTALGAIQQAVSENMDARTLTRLLIHRLRIILLMRFAPELVEALAEELTEADRELALEVSKSPSITSETLRALLEAHSRMAYSAVPHLPLELAILDITAQ